MKFNNNAQVNILEVILVAGLIFSALFFIQSLTVPSFPESYHTKKLKSRVDTALTSLDSTPDDEYHSLLVKYLIRNTSSDRSSFNSYLFESTYPSYGYNIYLINLTKMYRNSTATESEYKNLYLSYDPPQIGRKTQSSRIFVHNGFIYEVLIEMWYV